MLLDQMKSKVFVDHNIAGGQHLIAANILRLDYYIHSTKKSTLTEIARFHLSSANQPQYE